MENIKHLSFAIVIALLMSACSDDSGSTGPEPPPSKQEEASAEKQFVYNAMNYWYYWQDEVADLADNRFDDDNAKQEFLMGFSDAETLFEDLRYIDDDFSFFIGDYEEYQREQDGIFAALGFEYSFIYKFQNRENAIDDLLGYVQYVIPGSPADNAGLKRLDVFTKVDGTQLNESNVNDLLANNDAHELNLVDIEVTDQGISFPPRDTVNVASEQVIEDPVYLSTVIDTSSSKIGYMVYNSFRGNSHQALNDAFGDFKSQGIDELVLDLRYNPGGAVITSQLLSSMISGLGSSDVFADFSYNAKRSQQSEEVTFLDVVPLQNEDGEFETNAQGKFTNTEPINALSLNQVYVLVSRGTASASEALINGLRPYMDVVIIGQRTVGKDEGSLLLVDAPSPYLDEEEANPDHKKAIQPIVLKLVNSNGEDYPNGLFPDGFDASIGQNGACSDDNNDNCLSEITVENLQARPELGDPADPLLARAISIITGEPMPKRLADPRSIILKEVEVQKHRTNLRPHGKNMYIEPFMMPQKK